MIIHNSKIKEKQKNLQINALIKELPLTQKEKQEIKENIKSVDIVGVIDSSVANDDKNIKLIYLYKIIQNSDYDASNFIKHIDKHTKAHTLFEVFDGINIYYCMSNKYIDAKVILGNFYKTNFCNEYIIDININQTLYDIYCSFYTFVLGLKRHLYEEIESIENRKKEITFIDAQISSLRKKIKNCQQESKRFDMNSDVRTLIKQRQTLQN